MADEEAIGRNLAELLGIGVGCLQLGDFYRSLLPGSTAAHQDADVAELDVLDVVARDAHDERAVAWVDAVDNDIVDVHPPQLAYGHAFRPPHPPAQTQEERGIRDVTHGDVANGDILQQPAVHRLQGKTPAVLEDAVRDRDVFESAVRLGAELDAPCDPAAVGGALLRAPKGPVEVRALIVAGDLAVGDRHVLSRARSAESIGALQDDRIIVRRVDRAIGDAHVAAAIDVDAIAVGVDLDVVDGEVVHAGRQDAEVAAHQEGHIAYDDVAA